MSTPYRAKHYIAKYAPKQALIEERSSGAYARQSLSWGASDGGPVVTFDIPVTMPEPGVVVTVDLQEEYVLDLIDEILDVDNFHSAMRRKLAELEGMQEYDRLHHRPLPRRNIDVMIGRE